MRKPDIRIPVSELEQSIHPVFDKSFLSSPTVAALMGVSPSTLWQWVFLRGLTTADALKLADVYQRKAGELSSRAAQLRSLAESLESDEMREPIVEPEPPLAPRDPPPARAPAKRLTIMGWR